MIKQRKQAFTLVELIVVITILAILGTIAFISLQGYSVSARDSVRVGDMSKIKSSLELFILDAGKYPQTTGGDTITYSGSEAWTQGTFGEDTFKNVDRLDKIPKDPLTGREYIYSVTNTKQEYQLAGIIEGDVAFNPYLMDTSFAGDKLATIKIIGNYNGKLLKVNQGSITYILAVPSIVSSTGGTLESIIENNKLAYNGYKNLPFQYEGSSYNTLGESPSINLVNSGSYEVFSGTISDLTNANDSTDREALIVKLQSAYTSTELENIGEIANIIAASGDEIVFLSNTLVNNEFGGEIEIVAVAAESGGGGSTGLEIGTACSLKESGDIVYGDGTADGSTLACEDDIAVCSGDGTGYVIAACNLGATEVGLAAASYGNYYQWGNNYGSIEGGPTTPTHVDASSYGPGNYYNATDSNPYFIIGPNDWALVPNDNLWGNTDNTDTARQGPCLVGYHVPTQIEWAGLVSAGEGGSWDISGTTTEGTDMMNALKLPIAGYRSDADGTIQSTSDAFYKNSSVPFPGFSQVLRITSNNINTIDNAFRAAGHSLRCFKNL